MTKLDRIADEVSSLLDITSQLAQKYDQDHRAKRVSANRLRAAEASSRSFRQRMLEQRHILRHLGVAVVVKERWQRGQTIRHLQSRLRRANRKAARLHNELSRRDHAQRALIERLVKVERTAVKLVGQDIYTFDAATTSWVKIGVRTVERDPITALAEKAERELRDEWRKFWGVEGIKETIPILDQRPGDARNADGS